MIELIGDKEETAGVRRAGERPSCAMGDKTRRKQDCEEYEKRFHDFLDNGKD